jgi:hypothetical protein
VVLAVVNPNILCLSLCTALAQAVHKLGVVKQAFEPGEIVETGATRLGGIDREFVIFYNIIIFLINKL